MRQNWLVVVFVPLLGLVSFFGLGPVLLADGPMRERMITLAVVLLLYVLLIALWRAAARAFGRRR